MRKLIALAALTALPLAAVPAAAGTPTAQLAALAEFYPSGTEVFFAVRTDDAFLDELSDLSALVEPLSGMRVDVREELDRSLQTAPVPSTYEDLRAWLGDQASFGVVSLQEQFDDDFSNNAEVDVIAVIAITDQDAAVETLDAQMLPTSPGLTKSEGRNSTVLYTYDESSGMNVNAAFAVTDANIIITSSTELLETTLSGDFATLADDARFTDATGLLPASEYNAITYVDLQSTMQGLMAQMNAQFSSSTDPSMAQQAEIFEMLGPIYENYPAQAIGLTTLDGTTLTIDFAQTAFDVSALEGLPFAGAAMLTGEAVDPAFAANIPADAPFVLFGSGFGNQVSYGLDSLEWLMALGARQSAMMREFSSEFGADIDSDYVPLLATNFDGAALRAFIDASFAGFTGLNLSEQVLPALNGDYAIFGRVLPNEMLGSTYDTALVFEAADDAGLSTIYDSFITMMERYHTPYTVNGDVVETPWFLRGLLDVTTPQEVLDNPALDTGFLLNDNVFALGTLAAVNSVASGSDPLSEDPGFTQAQAYFLPDANVIGYVSGPRLLTVFDALYDLGQISGSDMDQLTVVLNQLKSATLSSSVGDDFSSTARLTITLTAGS